MTLPNLARISAAATPGPWIVQKEAPWFGDTPISLNDARLAAAAPEMAAQLIVAEWALRLAEPYVKHAFEKGGMHGPDDVLVVWTLARLADFDRGLA